MENHHFLMGKSTISMAIFNSYVKLPDGIPCLTTKDQFPSSTRTGVCVIPLVSGSLRHGKGRGAGYALGDLAESKVFSVWRMVCWHVSKM